MPYAVVDFRSSEQCIRRSCKHFRTVAFSR